MKQHIFLIDADNTLFPVGEQVIPKETQKCIKQAQKKGHIFALCTGRGLKDAQRIKGVKHFNYIAALTGTEMFDNNKKEIIQHPQPLKTQSVQRLVEQCEKKGYSWTYKTIKGENTIFKFGNKARFHAKKVTTKTYEKDLNNGKILQMLINFKVTKKTASMFPEFQFIAMPGGYADVLNKGVSKAKGVDFFKTRFPKAKIVAIGDAENDVGMFVTADISIAMGNATKSVKEKADFATKSVQENGVIYAITEILNSTISRNKKRRL